MSFDGLQTSTIDEGAGRVIETAVYEDPADALDLDAVAAPDHGRQGLGKGRHAIDDADIDRLGQVVRRANSDRVGHRHDRGFVVVDATPRAAADEADLTGVVDQAIRVDLKPEPPVSSWPVTSSSPPAPAAAPAIRRMIAIRPTIRPQGDPSGPPTPPQMALSEAAENSKTRTTDSPHCSRNALAIHVKPAGCTAQSPERTVFLITLSGFGANRGCFRRSAIEIRCFFGERVGNSDLLDRLRQREEDFQKPKIIKVP